MNKKRTIFFIYTMRQICSRTQATSQQPVATFVQTCILKVEHFPIICQSFIHFGWHITKIWQFMLNKILVEVEILIFACGEFFDFHSALWRLVSGSYWKHVSSPVTTDFRKFGLFSAAATMSLEWLILIDFWSLLNACGTNFAQTFVLPNLHMVRIVSLLIFKASSIIFSAIVCNKITYFFDHFGCSNQIWPSWFFVIFKGLSAFQKTLMPLKNSCMT